MPLYSLKTCVLNDYFLIFGNVYLRFEREDRGGKTSLSVVYHCVCVCVNLRAVLGAFLYAAFLCLGALNKW